MNVRGQLYAPVILTPGKNAGTHWRGGSVVHRAGLDVLEKRKISCAYQNSNPTLFSL